MLSCETCGENPLSSIRKGQGEVERGLKAAHQATKLSEAERESFRVLADGLVPYIEGLKRELSIAVRTFESAEMLSRTAPIYGVPDDILIEIFQQLFSRFTVVGGAANASAVHPYTLVCKRWREIITSIPTLWTTIAAPPSSAADLTSFPILLHYFNSQLKYTGSLPLVLDCSTGLSDSFYTPLKSVFPRISSLEVKPEYEEVPETIEFLSYFRNLTQLHMTMSQDPDTTFFLDNRLLTIHLPHYEAPQLTHVKLELDYPVDEITLPWSQLKFLSISLQNMIGGFNPCLMFAGLENIEELYVDLGSPDDIRPSRRGRLQVVLPHLRKLTLCSWESTREDFPYEFLRQAKLPSLRELVFNEESEDLQLAKAIKAARLSTLIKLTLHLSSRGEDTATDELINSLRGLRKLETFYCDANRDLGRTQRVLQSLKQVKPATMHFFPKLRLLAIERAHFDPQMLGIVRELLQNRVSPINIPADARKPLRDVLVFFDLPNERGIPAWNAGKQESRIHEYNDRVTSVRIAIRGKIADNFLEENLAACQLAGNYQ